MNKALFLILFLFSTISSGWDSQGKIEGFEISTRDEKNSNIKGVRAVGVLNAPLPDLMAHLRDVEGSMDWTPKQKEKKIITEVSDSEATTYSVTTMPWPLDDRDMIVHNKLFLDRDKKLMFVKSKSVNDGRYPENNKYERAYITYSNLALKPLTPKTTWVEMTIFADPNGIIPSWIVNYYQKRFPGSFLRALERHSQTKKIPLLPGLKNTLVDLLKVLELPEDYYGTL